jgi:hypothetical protein
MGTLSILYRSGTDAHAECARIHIDIRGHYDCYTKAPFYKLKLNYAINAICLIHLK